MNEVEIYKQTMGRQAQRIANLTLDLDLAHTQIDMLNEELKQLKNSDKEKDSE